MAFHILSFATPVAIILHPAAWVIVNLVKQSYTYMYIISFFVIQFIVCQLNAELKCMNRSRTSMQTKTHLVSTILHAKWSFFIVVRLSFAFVLFTPLHLFYLPYCIKKQNWCDTCLTLVLFLCNWCKLSQTRIRWPPLVHESPFESDHHAIYIYIQVIWTINDWVLSFWFKFI